MVRKHDHQEAEYGNSILETLMESSIDLIFLKDLEGKYIEVNAEFCKFVGVPRREIIGQKVGLFFEESQRMKINESDRNVLTTKKPFVNELDFYKEDQRYILETIKSPLKSKNGEIIGFFGISRDITSRKLADEALRTNQHLLKQSEKQSLSGSFEFDTLNQSLYCSNQLLKNLGFPDEKRKISFDEFLNRINEAERKIFEVELKRAISERIDFCMEHRCTRLDNQKVSHFRTLIIPDELGREHIYFGIVTDITKDRQLRESIIDIQEKERKTIASNLHDSLGQKLVAAKMFVNESSGDKQSEHLERASRLIDQSIQEIRSLSKSLSINALKGQGLKSAIYDVVSNIPDATSVGHQLDFDESEICDELRTQIYRIIQESVTNILKHAKADQVKVLINRESQFLNLVISDNGVGFDTRIDHQGNGLRNIRERVARFSGFLEIQSNPGHTTIRIKFPLK